MRIVVEKRLGGEQKDGCWRWKLVLGGSGLVGARGAAGFNSVARESMDTLSLSKELTAQATRSDSTQRTWGADSDRR
jgi:hypothetical protein